MFVLSLSTGQNTSVHTGQCPSSPCCQGKLANLALSLEMFSIRSLGWSGSGFRFFFFSLQGTPKGKHCSDPQSLSPFPLLGVSPHTKMRGQKGLDCVWWQAQLSDILLSPLLDSNIRTEPSETNCQLWDPTLAISLANSLLDESLLVLNTPTYTELHLPMLVI